MQVAQRGTSSTGVTGAGYKACDRWIYDGASSSVYTMEQSTDAPDGFGNSFKVTTTTSSSLASSDWEAIQQRIEGQDVQGLNFGGSNASNYTVSFWVKASIAGGYSVGVYYDDGPSTAKYMGQGYTINAANTWEYKTLTFPAGTLPINNDNTVGLRIYFCYRAGTDRKDGQELTWGDTHDWFVGQEADIGGTTNATFQITGVQLELGSVATPFEHRSYGEELALCQRYYQEFSYRAAGNWDSAFGTDHFHVQHITPMRTTPTIRVFDYVKDGHVSGDLSNVSGFSHTDAAFIVWWTGANTHRRDYGYSASGRFGVEAEL